MPSGILLTLVSILVGLASYIYLIIQRSFPDDGFRHLRAPGPVLLGAADGANLDGLTLIRAVKMPALTLIFPGIGKLTLKNSTSEMAFQTLRVREVSITSQDVATGETKIEGNVNAHFTALSSARISFVLHPSWLGVKERRFERQSNGKMLVHLEDLSVSLHLRLGKNQAGHSCIKHTLFRINSGRFKNFAFTGLKRGDIATNIPLQWTLQPMVNFLLTALLESHEIRLGATSLWAQLYRYMDLEAWQNIHASTRDTAVPVLSEAGINLFKCHFALAGLTSIVNIKLPDHIPSLYPQGGKRAKLQSWNMLTSEVKLEITQNIIRKLSFEKAVLEVNAAPSLAELPMELAEASVLVCRLEEFRTEVSSHFALYADTSKALKFVTGMSTLGEHGTSKAVVVARRLELVFALFVKETGVTVQPLRTDDFDRIDISIEGLRSKRDDFVNGILKVVRPQMSAFISVMIKRFLEAEVKKGTDGIEKVEEALLVSGIEVPGLFRLRPRLAEHSAQQKEA